MRRLGKEANPKEGYMKEKQKPVISQSNYKYDSRYGRTHVIGRREQIMRVYYAGIDWRGGIEESKCMINQN